MSERVSYIDKGVEYWKKIEHVTVLPGTSRVIDRDRDEYRLVDDSKLPNEFILAPVLVRFIASRPFRQGMFGSEFSADAIEMCEFVAKKYKMNLKEALNPSLLIESQGENGKCCYKQWLHNRLQYAIVIACHAGYVLRKDGIWAVTLTAAETVNDIGNLPYQHVVGTSSQFVRVPLAIGSVIAWTFSDFMDQQSVMLCSPCIIPSGFKDLPTSMGALASKDLESKTKIFLAELAPMPKSRTGKKTLGLRRNLVAWIYQSGTTPKYASANAVANSIVKHSKMLGVAAYKAPRNEWNSVNEDVVDLAGCPPANIYVETKKGLERFNLLQVVQFDLDPDRRSGNMRIDPLCQGGRIRNTIITDRTKNLIEEETRRILIHPELNL